MVSCWMPGDPKDCRDHAKACIRLATSAKTTEAAIVFENLASTWLRLAADLETSAILLADLERLPLAKSEAGATFEETVEPCSVARKKAPASGAFSIR
jgi:hypothetical protein